MVVKSLAIKQKTPIGATFISKVTSFKIITFKSSKMSPKRLPGSPLSAIAIPNSNENTITCSIFPLAMALIGLVGNMLIITWTRLGALLLSKVASVGIATPSPGLKNNAKLIATVIAIAVVNKYSAMDFPPKRPSLAGSLKLQVPQTKEIKTKGTTSIFKLAIKMAPPI